jgi:hypothetical protein
MLRCWIRKNTFLIVGRVLAFVAYLEVGNSVIKLMPTNPLRPSGFFHVPPCLTFTNSTFCPHSVFMCPIYISEQTAIISLCSINRLVCITEMVCVYCAVRTVFMCFVWISEQTAIISLYCINWLVCITETVCVYCAVRTVFMCFVWISEQTAIISLYSINWVVCITEAVCVYCAVRTGFLYTNQVNFCL